MPFPLNPADKQRYKNYTYDGASRSWKQDFIYQEQLDFGNEDGKLNSSDIPVYNSPGETVHEYIIDSVSLTKEQTIDGIKTFSSTISGSIDGNAATVSNGVYTTGDQSIAGIKTFSHIKIPLSEPVESGPGTIWVDLIVSGGP